MISLPPPFYLGAKLVLVVALWLRGRKERRDDLEAVRKTIRHDQVVLTRFLRDEIRKHSNAGTFIKNN